MLIIVWQSQFKKDFKAAVKQNKDMDKLAHIIGELQLSKLLPPKKQKSQTQGKLF